MADLLKFVDYDYSISGGLSGDVLLDINDGSVYCFDEFEFPIAKPSIEWRDPAHGDGRDVSRHKYENREVTIKIHIFGTDKDDLSTNARALWDQLLSERPILLWQADGWDDPLFIDLVSPPNDIRTPDWFVTAVRNGRLCVMANIEIDLEAKPFLRAPQESLWILRNLGANDSFEVHDGDNFSNWVEAGTVANSATALDGLASCSLTAPDGVVTDGDFIPVDATRYHAIQCYAYEVSGAPTLDIDIVCYNDLGAVLGTLTPLVAYNPASATTWLEAVEIGGTPVISPAGSGGAQSFPVGTTKIKRVFRNDAGVAGVILIDKLSFGDTHLIPDHKPSGAIGISVPPDDLHGDVPALCDFYFSNPYSPGEYIGQNSTVETDLNAVTAYDASNVWACGDDGVIVYYDGLSWAAQTSGVSVQLNAVSAGDSTHVWAVGDDGTILYTADGGATWGTQTCPPAIVDGGLEIWSDGNHLTNWTYTGTMIAGTYGSQHSGTYCAVLDMPAGSVAKLFTTNAYLVANPGEVLTVDYWIRPDSGGTTSMPTLSCYDGSHTLIGTINGTSFYQTGSTYVHNTCIFSAIPEGTSYVKLNISVSSTSVHQCWLDDISLMRNFFGVHAITSTNIIAVGAGGTIIKSDDGTTWAEQTSGVTATLRAVHAFDATHIIAVGDDGTIVTSDDGETWTVQTSGTTKNLYGVYALDATHYWAVGEGGEILFSADAGVNWSAQVSGIGSHLRSVYAFDSTHIWAVGDVGVILFGDGVAWIAKSGGGTTNWRGVDGISATSLWIVGDGGSILYGVALVAPILTTNIIMGQRARYSSSYNPVLDAVGATLTNLYTCRNQKYRSMATGGARLTEEFRYQVEVHKGRYIPSAHLTWAANTAEDGAVVEYCLEIPPGTVITSDTQEETVDMGDMTSFDTKFREVMLNSWDSLENWSIVNIPSFQLGDSADLAQMYQACIVKQDPDDDQAEWLDYFALIPIDGSFVNIDGWTANYLIIDSSQGLVLASLNGEQDQAQAYSRAHVKGFPQFEADPNGMNLTLLTLYEVTNNQQANNFCNIEMRYSPLYLLVPEG
jgi:photosystem II stability/assembly factor-like uncharacterized protein